MEENLSISKAEKAKLAKKKHALNKNDLLCPITFSKISKVEYFNLTYKESICRSRLRSPTAFDAYNFISEFEKTHIKFTDALPDKLPEGLPATGIRRELLDEHEHVVKYDNSPADIYISKKLNDLLMPKCDNVKSRATQVARILLMHDSSHPIGKHVFVCDKKVYSEALGFKNGLAYYSAQDMVVAPNEAGFIRFNGSRTGSSKYGMLMDKITRDHNMPILRYLQEGNTKKTLTCRISGEFVEDISFKMKGLPRKAGNKFELHHIRVENRTSVTKSGRDPSAILKSVYLDTEAGKKGLIDLMGTVSLTKSEHENVHLFPNSDINNYYDYQLPWCLKSEKNFNKVCAKYSLDLTYAEFIKSLSSKN